MNKIFIKATLFTFQTQCNFSNGKTEQFGITQKKPHTVNIQYFQDIFVLKYNFLTVNMP